MPALVAVVLIELCVQPILARRARGVYSPFKLTHTLDLWQLKLLPGHCYKTTASTYYGKLRHCIKGVGGGCCNTPLPYTLDRYSVCLIWTSFIWKQCNIVKCSRNCNALEGHSGESRGAGVLSKCYVLTLAYIAYILSNGPYEFA